jgi:hypothetical protein
MRDRRLICYSRIDSIVVNVSLQYAMLLLSYQVFRTIGFRPIRTRAQFFFVVPNAHRYLHPHLFVETLCSRQALTIDAQSHTRDAELVKSIKGLP